MIGRISDAAQAASFLLLVAFSTTTAAVELNLTVFYESRCPDSESYFETQLKPTIEKYPNINLELVPYGKATSVKVGDEFRFQCQHGEMECEGNMFHACAIKQTQDDIPLQLTVTTCLIDDFYQESPKERAATCCNKHGVDFDELLRCKESKEGAQLLYDYGIQTGKWNPSFIPLILLNNEDGNQEELLSDLQATISKLNGSSNEEEISNRMLFVRSGQEKLRGSLMILSSRFIAIPQL